MGCPYSGIESLDCRESDDSDRGCSKPNFYPRDCESYMEVVKSVIGNILGEEDIENALVHDIMIEIARIFGARTPCPRGARAIFKQHIAETNIAENPNFRKYVEEALIRRELVNED